MSCSSNPAGSPITFDIQYFLSSQCFGCQDNGCSTYTNSVCIFYAGPNLSCSGIETNDSLEIALQKIDTQICSAIGDYSNYQFNCLDDWFGEQITQESQFVNAITAYACETVETLEEFTGTTFPAFETSVTNRFDETNSPGITCASASVTALDDLQTVLEKYCTKFGEIDSAIDLSAVDWDQCLTVISPPTTISAAFSLVVDQICQVQATAGGALPTFNNLGSCLPSPGSADTLVSTIGKIKTRLCQSPTFNSNNVTWGCVSSPSDDEDIEEAITNINTAITTSLQALPTFSGDFIVTATNVSDPCAGVTVSLATPLNQDRFVASTASDSSPGTLQSKVTAGTGITLDFLSTPGQMIVSADSAVLDYKVKASSGDDDPGFLDQKIEGSDSSGITLTPIYNSITKQLDLTLAVNTSALFDLLLDELIPGTDLYNKFCTKVSLCPCNCDAANCTQYEVAIAGGTVNTQVDYIDCASGNTITTYIAPSSSVLMCARNGSIVVGATDGAVSTTAIQDCAGGTTSTSTTTTTTPP